MQALRIGASLSGADGRSTDSPPLPEDWNTEPRDVCADAGTRAIVRAGRVQRSDVRGCAGVQGSDVYSIRCRYLLT